MSAKAVVLGGMLVVVSSLFKWFTSFDRFRLDFDLSGVVNPANFPGDKRIVFLAGLVAVTIGLIGLRWRFATGTAAVAGVVSLFLTSNRASEIAHRADVYEPLPAPPINVVLWVGMSGSVLVVVAGFVSVAAMLLGKLGASR